MLRINNQDNGGTKMNRNSLNATASNSNSTTPTSAPGLTNLINNFEDAANVTDKNPNNLLKANLNEDQLEETEKQEHIQNSNQDIENDEDDDEIEDDEEEEDEYDDEDDEENSFLSPMVQVKYGVEYDYDEKKFQLIEGEKLFLISKANEDWWLCLRLEENLTFFVPASYVKELIVNKSLQPPPRPPPPPPSILKKYSTTNTNSNDKLNQKPPEVKKRQFININTSADNKPVVLEENTDLNQIYEKLSNLNTKNLIDEDDEAADNSMIDSIIEDLDECLEKEERSSFVNNTNMNKNLVNNDSKIANQSNQFDQSTLITNLSSLRNSLNPTQNDEDKRNDDNHIYQNLPLVKNSKDNQNVTDKTNSDKTLKEKSKNEFTEQEEEVGFDDEDIDDDYAEEDEEIENVAEEDDEYEEEIIIPKGWKCGMSKCKRKYFYNEYNKDKWFLNYDPNGKHYFYNADNQAVWELPVLFYKNENEKKEDKEKGFRQNFDEDLPTFKNLYNRLSIRLNPKESPNSKQPINDESTTKAGAVASIYPKLPGTTDPEQENSNQKVSSLTSSNKETVELTQFTRSVNYSHKAPNDLSSNFKCIVLEKIGKKCKKKNSENYRVTLASTKLLFVKEAKTAKLEFFVDFKGGKCYKVVNPRKLSNATNNNIGINNNNNSSSNSTNNNSNSKDNNNNINVKNSKEKEKEKAEIIDLVGNSRSAFVIETLIGYKILIMNENENLINEWVLAINSIITQVQSEFSPIYEGPELLHSIQMQDNDKFLLSSLPQYSSSSHSENTKTKGKTKAECENGEHKSEKFSFFHKSPKTSHSKQHNDDQANTIVYSKNRDELKIDLKNDKSMLMLKLPDNMPAPPQSPLIMRRNIIINYLNYFLNRRPPIEQLKKQGIIQECVYGASLINLCKREKRNVPLFVEEITSAIESRGLDMDGLYRISGNLSEVQKLRNQVDHGKLNFKDFDIHVLCGALKSFFRELEDPLIPFGLHQHFLASFNIQEKPKRFLFVHELLKKMPIAHRETLRHLLRHLLKVIDLASQNRMNVQNIALVFGPNIMRSNPINENNFGFNPNIMTQNVLVEYMLVNFKELFSFQSNSIFTEYTNY